MLVSYDVANLFTNIPLQETIDIAINLIFNHNPNLKITKKELNFFFLFTTSQTHFIFNNKFYNQIDGVAMGCHLAPVLANIFMGFYEFKWVNKLNLNKPKFYLRCVDDILAPFDKEQDSLIFLHFLNKRHPNIKFTIVKQINHSITFLDVFILGINNKIEEHIKKDNKFHIFKHLHSTGTSFDSYNSISFKIIDKSNSKFDDLKIKEALHINSRKPNLNAQQNHLALSLSL